MKYILPKLLALLTFHDRYIPVIEWSDKSWTHNVFRTWELIFGRRVGIRAESTTKVERLENGNIQIHREFYTLESVIAYTESFLRESLKNKFEFNPVYATVILDIMGLRKQFAYNNGLFDNLGYRFAIAYDSSNTGTASSTSVTYSLTTSGSDRFLAVANAIIGGFTTDVLTGITYNSDALTRVGMGVIQSNVRTYLYQMVAPDTGSSYSVVATSSASTLFQSIAMSYSGASQTGQPDSSSSGNATLQTVITATTTVVASNCWLVGSLYSNAAGLSAGSGTILRGTVGDGRNGGFDSNGTVGTGAQSLIANCTLDNIGWVVCSFAPASSTTIKTWNGIVRANLKTLNGTASASIKSINGIQ